MAGMDAQSRGYVTPNVLAGSRDVIDAATRTTRLLVAGVGGLCSLDRLGRFVRWW